MKAVNNITATTGSVSEFSNELENGRLPVDVYQKLLSVDTSYMGKNRIHIVNAPGKFFSSDQKQSMLKLFTHVCFDIYQADTSHYWEKRQDYFDQLDTLVIITEQDRFLGWLGVNHWQVDHKRIIYMDTLNVMRSSQKSMVGAAALFRLVFKTAFLKHRQVYVVFRSQNPVIYRLGEKYAASMLYPKLDDNETTSEDILQVARYVANKTSPGKQFNERSFVIEKAYPSSLYGKQSPKSAYNRINAFFSQHLKPEQGDALIGIAKLSHFSLHIIPCLLLYFYLASAGTVSAISANIKSIAKNKLRGRKYA